MTNTKYKSSFLIIILLFLSINSFAQFESMMLGLTNKKINFKLIYDSVLADYEVNSDTITLSNNQIINLTPYNSYYFKGIFVSKKMDLDISNKDTIICTYGFFKNRLFYIEVFSNSSFHNKKISKTIQENFDISVLPKNTRKINGRYNKTKTFKKTHIMYDYQFDKDPNINRLKVSFTYAPIIKFLPIWCGTFKKKKWDLKMERKLK